MSGVQMEPEEFHLRLEAARVRAALQRLEAVEVLAKNVDLRHENGEAFARTGESARQLREDREIGGPPKPIQPSDADR
jgi:hypothetical protein